MLKTVYHASLSKITKWNIPHNGLHFGTKESAYTAVERKVIKEDANSFYLHKVLIDVSNVEDVFDAGEDWKDALDGDTSKVYSYTNKYEPSTDKSYVMFSTDYIKDTLETIEVSADDLYLFI